MYIFLVCVQYAEKYSAECARECAIARLWMKLESPRCKHPRDGGGGRERARETLTRERRNTRRDGGGGRHFGERSGDVATQSRGGWLQTPDRGIAVRHRLVRWSYTSFKTQVAHTLVATSPADSAIPSPPPFVFSSVRAASEFAWNARVTYRDSFTFRLGTRVRVYMERRTSSSPRITFRSSRRRHRRHHRRFRNVVSSSRRLASGARGERLVWGFLARGHIARNKKFETSWFPEGYSRKESRGEKCDARHGARWPRREHLFTRVEKCVFDRGSGVFDRGSVFDDWKQYEKWLSSAGHRWGGRRWWRCCWLLRCWCCWRAPRTSRPWNTNWSPFRQPTIGRTLQVSLTSFSYLDVVYSLDGEFRDRIGSYRVKIN